MKVIGGYEADFARIVSDIQDVSELKSGYVIIPYTFNNTIRRFIVDFYLIYKGRKFLVEIKSWNFTMKFPEVPYKFISALKYCKDNDITFIVLTKDEINKDYLLNMLEGNIDIKIPYIDYEYNGILFG